MLEILGSINNWVINKGKKQAREEVRNIKLKFLVFTFTKFPKLIPIIFIEIKNEAIPKKNGCIAHWLPRNKADRKFPKIVQNKPIKILPIIMKIQKIKNFAFLILVDGPQLASITLSKDLFINLNGEYKKLSFLK